jgi:hypothetical protein
MMARREGVDMPITPQAAPPNAARMKIKRMALILIGIAVVLCGGMFTSGIVRSFGVGGVKGTDDRVTLKSSDATVTFGAGPGTTKMPSWIPVYPGSKVEAIYSANTSQGFENTYSFKSSDAEAKIAAFYQEQLKGNGFRVSQMLSGDSGGMISGKTEDKKKTVVVTIARTSDHTQVSVMAVEKK